MNKLRDAASFLKNKFQTDELDQKLAQAVSEQNWQASTQLLHQIANASYNFEKEQRIVAFIWDKIKSKSWKKVLKTLHLVDFLLKYGPTTLIETLRENIYDFRQLDDYTYQSEGIDRGQSIRKQSKILVTLLTDDQMLSDQRAKAKQIKERMASVIGSGAYYGNFSSSTLTDTTTKNEYKQPVYPSFSSESSNFSGPTNIGGPSFGESVMRELHQKKKVSYPVQPQKTNPSKLNLNKMNERKTQKKQQQKSNFNNLSHKLVKPPEKRSSGETKPLEKKISENKPQIKATVQHAHQSKPLQNNVDIMDLDFISLGNNISQPSKQVGNIDFLTGSSSTQHNQSANLFQLPTTHTTAQPSTFSNNFLIDNKSVAPQFTLNNQQKPSIQPTSVPYSSQNQFGFQANTNVSQGFSLNTYPSTNSSNFNHGPSAPQQKSGQISLNLNSQSIVEDKPSNGLIDFSNFRQELSSVTLKNDKKQNIVSGWNW